MEFCKLSKEPKLVHVRETKEIYEKATLKWFETTPNRSLNWVYNILENKSSEVPIFNDTDEQTGNIALI